ncbi:electron transport complex subunit E [Stutzerimonas kirkiae]|uniref:Ion-translocating oxidoreductase complex subunit E n=1 Tax=Stutzerimonas kirkiae TaxID=2211392 RepID=A0A4Q9RCD2_9GAMM|nr:electron transport complex subunit RsxE [Stutzerimonas kirkiae]TBV03904.1 electron transport complex subunit RsxE [Stutzerimonas kirkiae]TBV09682.1 electron transport complex subunit RsxE [Stutzerimonas kirkiae]TBV16784.1 electron transport complex subunit RsxE [Stutzerimonas kirkiae]
MSQPTSNSSPLLRQLGGALWGQNIALVQLLALCPALAVTTSATNGLGMGLATTLVLMLTNALISALRHTISQAVRTPVIIGIIAGVVTLLDMAINAWMHELYKVLGLFIALITTNCAVYGRAEAFCLKNPVLPSVIDGLGIGLGFTWVLVLIGGIRELLGSGTLFAQASLLLGDGFRWLETTLIADFQGILLAILPPGAFIVLGFLLAAKRLLDRRQAARRLSSSGELVVLQ